MPIFRTHRQMAYTTKQKHKQSTCRGFKTGFVIKWWSSSRTAPTVNRQSFRLLIHFGASHAHTMNVISSAVNHCNSKLTSLLPAWNTLQVIKQPYTPSSMVWLLLLLETAFVCLLIHYEETVHVQFIIPNSTCCSKLVLHLRYFYWHYRPCT